MNRWRIASLGTTKIYLQPAMVLYALYAILIGHGWFMMLAMLSIILHECAHALVSSILGNPPSNLEITPMGAVMRLEDERRLSTSRQLFVLLAGPTMTILLAWAALHLTRINLLPVETGHLLFMSNLSILLLNLLPVYPLDGGRILAVVLSHFLSFRKVSRIMRLIGIVLGIALVIANIYASLQLGGWNFSLAFAGCCILYSSYAATTTQALAELRSFVERKIQLERKGCMEIREICALHTIPVRVLVSRLPRRQMAEFVCVEAGSMYEKGRIFEAQLIQHYLSTPDATLGTAVQLLQNIHSTAKYDTI